jgi:hypothetical protein
MTTARVMSWNIESLGDAKATVANPTTTAISQSEIINFINLVIRQAEADIVGIMEVKSGRGLSILGWLLPRLNNVTGATYQWQGRVSARQDGGTQEETLYLWKQEASVLTLDQGGLPAPLSSPGIVDGNVLQATFSSIGIATQPAKQDDFLTALFQAGYINHGTYTARGKKRVATLTWRLHADQWHTLSTGGTVSFGSVKLPVAPLTPTQLKALTAQLVGTDILRFSTYSDRSPFLGNFLVGNPAKRLMVSVLHAPGPQDLLRTDAVNIIGLSNCAAAADNLAVMGDFNIATNQSGLTAVVYGRFNYTGNWAFTQERPRTYQTIFDPIKNAPLNAGDRVLKPNPRTTVIDGYVTDKTPLNTILANTYDKVFFHPNASAAKAFTTANPWAWNLVMHMDPKSKTDFWKTSAQSALTFFRAFRGDAYLGKADSNLVRKHAKQQKTFTQEDNKAKKLQAKINGMNPKPALNDQVYTRLSEATAKATKANQQLAAIQLQRGAIKDLRDLINGTDTTPSGVGTALAIYREAISDHFPISLDLTT